MSADADGVDSGGRAQNCRLADAAWDDARGLIERRAVIEQTKGMLMVIYGIDADAAFELLRWQSQQHNVKVGLLAERIATDLVDLFAVRRESPQGLDADHLLLTAHQRVAEIARGATDGASLLAD
jgi:hypothetical protein